MGNEMEREVVTKKWGRTMEYLRYTQPGTGPANGRNKVGDTVPQSEITVEYIDCEVPGEFRGTIREHGPKDTDVPVVMCKVVAITQRRNGYVDQNGKFQIHYYDSWFKLERPDGSTFWNSGNPRKWHYKRVGAMSFKDWDEYVEWSRQPWTWKLESAGF